MKLTSTLLAPYLAGGLRLVNKDGRCSKPLCGADIDMLENYPHFFDDIPLLRPAEDLIKPIEHNGETFIPLVRLAEIHGWDDSVKIEEENGTYIIVGDTAIHPGNGETLGHYFFEIDTEDFDIDWGFENACGSSTFYPVKNQIQLYEKLLEWNFDIYKLIDEGLAKRL